MISRVRNWFDEKSLTRRVPLTWSSCTTCEELSDLSTTYEKKIVHMIIESMENGNREEVMEKVVGSGSVKVKKSGCVTDTLCT